MELYQLKYFSKAAEYENISMAAQELHVTQPSISKAIKALEKELQVDLMQRNGKYCVLTHEGRMLLSRIRPILSEMDSIPEELHTGYNRKQIRLNVLSACLLVPELIRKFREKRPDVFFRVMEQRGAISWDLCIRSTLPQAFSSDAEKLLDEKLLLACRTDHWIAGRESVSLAELQNEDFIILRKGGSIRTLSDAKFRDLGFIPRVAFECDNFYILKRMVAEGLGIALWPQYTWREKLEEDGLNGQICLRPLDIPDFYRSLYLIRSRDIKMTEEMEEFQEFSKEYFKLGK